MEKLLSDFSTKELVRELMNREGVKSLEVAPYEDMEVKVNGACIVLTVID